jgi:hypothetical protein
MTTINKAMSSSQAFEIISCLDDPEITNKEKAVAIHIVMGQPKRNNVTKAQMERMIRWLWELSFQWTDEEDHTGIWED